MRVLLVHLPVGFEEAYPLALAALVPGLVATGASVEGLDVGRVGLRALQGRLRRGDVDLVGLSVWSPGADAGRRVIAAIRAAAPRVTIVVGGPHPTLAPEDELGADVVVLGEGEASFPAVVRAGGAWRAVPGVYGGPGAAPLDLATLPHPDRTVFAVPAYHREHRPPGRRYTAVVTSRGCRHACRYCSAPALWGRHVRFRPIEAVLDEWRRLRVDHGVDGVLVEDDHFLEDRARSLALLDALARRPPGVTFELLNGVRPDAVDPPLVAALAAAGCTRLALGLETASASGQRALGRRLELAHVTATIAACRTHGLGVTGYFVLGLPEETAADRLATFRLATDLKLDMAHFSQLSAWPGAQLSGAPIAVDPRLRAAAYAGYYLHPGRALRVARKLEVRPHELPEMGHRLWSWMTRPLESRRSAEDVPL